jgi:hypothetical protein
MPCLAAQLVASLDLHTEKFFFGSLERTRRLRQLENVQSRDCKCEARESGRHNSRDPVSFLARSTSILNIHHPDTMHISSMHSSNLLFCGYEVIMHLSMYCPRYHPTDKGGGFDLYEINCLSPGANARIKCPP